MIMSESLLLAVYTLYIAQLTDG